MVGREGYDPSIPFGRKILSLERIPIPPPSHIQTINYIFASHHHYITPFFIVN